MEQAGMSSERTPLVQPTYVFESTLSRRYRKRLRNCQCAVCVSILVFLSVILLVTVSYNLANDLDDDDDNGTIIPLPIPVTNISTDLTSNLTDSASNLTRSGNLTTSGANLTTSKDNLKASGVNLTASGNYTVHNLTTIQPNLQPIINQKWPLEGKPSAPWPHTPSPQNISAAVTAGKAALAQQQKAERVRRALAPDSPAHRAQRAAATAVEVKPLADAAYAAEEATKALVNGSNPKSRGGVGVGPPTNGSFPEPPYCGDTTPVCPSSKYRSLDGSCNNLAQPLRWGVSRTPFRRVLPADYGDGISSPRTGVNGSTLPSARDVSVTVHRPSYAHDISFTVMLAVWGQFIDHDITATALSKGENGTALSCCDPSQPPHPACFPVPLAVQDPFYQSYQVTCMEFVRSAPAPTCHFSPREQMNQATAYLDGSTVYGYSATRAMQLRTGEGGLLRMLEVGGVELLPPSVDPNDGCNTVEMNAQGRYCFETGDDRANENLHLTTMHLLWARQHNRLARGLAALNPRWEDQTLYQEARKIVGAQMQHITYNEFLPLVLGDDVMWALNLSLRTGGRSGDYDPQVDASVANHFSAAAFRFAHTLLPGLIHSFDADNGSVDYVHLHEMLFNPYTLYWSGGARRSVHSALNTPVHSVDPHVTDELSNHLFEQPISTNSSLPAHPCGLDLVSLNIQRGRDHGLPPYPAWREHCGFPRPKTFEDLVGVFNEVSWTRISTIYSHVDDIDLYTGALAEDPQGRLLGATLTCLLADQFLRVKIGDRFWYETEDEVAGFTIEQLTEIRKTTLAGVICANEESLAWAQPRVMELVGATNPLVSCKELPQLELTPWKV
ncbi:salivary peroxidase/catechol oxidase-like [Choristoneura fumiferana]|uniref:salivary peroxidase/catechol oxidase-like n=1 Tax=Choristoneura fumiferana TaxID=7141 RepID=UPI003D15531B